MCHAHADHQPPREVLTRIVVDHGEERPCLLPEHVEDLEIGSQLHAELGQHEPAVKLEIDLDGRGARDGSGGRRAAGLGQAESVSGADPELPDSERAGSERA